MILILASGLLLLDVIIDSFGVSDVDVCIPDIESGYTLSQNITLILYIVIILLTIVGPAVTF